jgi:uncharacterized protein YdaU (DUF1376 family)
MLGMHYYKRFINDYRSKTAHLSWDEDAAYNRLLDIYYVTEEPLPADIAKTCRLARASKPGHRQAIEAVLGEFFELKEDGWHQKRADEEIQAAFQIAERNRQNGTQGGRPPKPKQNPDETQSVNSGIDLATLVIATSHSQEPRANPEKISKAISLAASNGSELDGPEKRKRWAGNVVNWLCQHESPERAEAVFSAWERGEGWAKKEFERVSAILQANRRAAQ